MNRVILKNIRFATGRRGVEPHLAKKLRIHMGCFKDLFKVEVLDMEDKDGNPIRRPLIYCYKPKELRRRVLCMRGLDPEEQMAKKGFDKGKKSYKVVESYYNPGDILCLKKLVRSSTIGGGAGFKSTSARKVMPLAIAWDMPETHDNIRQVMEKCKV